MKKVIVTGASGFIGYHLVNELSQNGYMIWALCNPHSESIKRIRNISNIHIIECAMENIFELPDIICERDFEAFFHLAWRGITSGERTSWRVQLDNIKWSLEALEVAEIVGCKKFVMTGSVCERQCDSIIINRKFSDAAFYLFAKRDTYQFMHQLCKKKSIELVWCAFYHPIGRFNKDSQIIAGTITKLINSVPPQFDNGYVPFDIIAVEDLVYGLRLASEKKLEKDWYFIGSGDPHILSEYIYIIRDMVSPNMPVIIGDNHEDGRVMKFDWLDSEPFAMETGYSPKIPFEIAVKKVHQYIKEQYKDENSVNSNSNI